MRNESQRPRVSSGRFEEEVISSLVFGPKEVDCAEMELTDGLANKPRTIKGPGFLKRDEDGRISFKIYAVDPSAVRRVAERPFTAGKIIDRKFYYELKAKDIRGETWSSDHILPTFTWGRFALVHGFVHELRSEKTSNFPTQGSFVRMQFFANSDFPCNASTGRRTIRDREEAGAGPMTLDLAKFSSCGFNFLLHQEPGSIVVEVASDDIMPPHLESRVTEALQFVLAQTLHCRISERIIGETCSIRVTPEQPKSFRTQVLPPLDFLTEEADAKPNPVWEMFDKYLRFVLPHTGPNWHPCSIHIHKAREASANSVEAWALGLSVSVEGLVKILRGDIGKPSASFKSAVSHLREYVEKWEGVPGWDGDASLRGRLPGLINQLTSFRPVDRLHQLAREEAIEERLVDSWKRLRNLSAHAETPDAQDHQNFYDSIMSASVLLNQLVFGAIGYEGDYSDYSKHGFPVRRYPPRLNTYLRFPDQ